MPTARQVHEALARKFTPEQLQQVREVVDMMLDVVNEIEATHRPNPSLQP